MRFVAVLNRDGGTLRTIDLDEFSSRLRKTLEAAGHSVDIDIVSGKGLVAALEKAEKADADVVLAGGGDGTISAAAAKLMNSDKALAILPAGTMNLFARSLDIPMSLDEAVSELASGSVISVDMASANGRPFVHQFSVGMHATLIDLRSKMEFASRLGKIRASLKAAWETIRNPKAMDVNLVLDTAEVKVRATAIGISNNLFGEGHLPYAEKPDGGTLGVYLTVSRLQHEIMWLLVNMVLGKWRDNRQVEIHQSKSVTLIVQSRHKRQKSAIDGELCELSRETLVKIHPGALRVLVPHTRAAATKAA